MSPVISPSLASSKQRLHGWFFEGYYEPVGPSCPTRAPDRLVEGHVPHGRGLFLHPRLPAEHRVSRGRRPLSGGDARPDPADALRRAAHVQTRGRDEPARPGEHPDSRGAVSPLEGKSGRLLSAGVRRDRLRDHHHAVGGGRDGASHPESVDAGLARPSRDRDARPARRPRRDLSQRLRRSDYPRGGARRSTSRSTSSS